MTSLREIERRNEKFGERLGKGCGVLSRQCVRYRLFDLQNGITFLGRCSRWSGWEIDKKDLVMANVFLWPFRKGRSPPTR